MNQKSTIGFIGGGRVTRLLLQALKQKDALPEKVVIADPSDDMKKQVQAIDDTAINCVSKNTDALNVDILFLAVHPPVMKDVAAEISGEIGADTLVVSLIPVLAIEKLTAMLGVTKLARMIPNAPSIIHQGYNPVVYSSAITSEEKQELQRLFSHWGEAPEVDEKKLEAYAIVTAMGPTYFWPQWVKLQALGKEFGMSDEELQKAMTAMLDGSVQLMYHSDLSPEQVMDLIPVYPLKDKEPDILGFFESSLTALHQKLTGTAK